MKMRLYYTIALTVMIAMLIYFILLMYMLVCEKFNYR